MIYIYIDGFAKQILKNNGIRLTKFNDVNELSKAGLINIIVSVSNIKY